MRSILIAFIILTSGFSAFAAGNSFLPDKTDAEREFKSSFEKKDYREALNEWPQGSAFSDSQDGRAIRDFLLAENGLPISAIRLLLQDTAANRLSPGVIELWKPVLNSYLPEIPPGWSKNASWMRLFPSDPPPLRKKSEIARRLKRAERLSSDVAKAKELWVIATGAPQFNDVKSALAALSKLRACNQHVIGPDQIALATARVLYQKGDLDQAIKEYTSIPKSSDFWVESLEERAWAYLRKGDHDRAVSDIATLLSSPLSPLVGPEPYFLAELDSLKICDYPRILKTEKLFKDRHKLRLTEIEKLAKTGTNRGLAPLFESFDQHGFNFDAAGPNIVWMPKDFMRDREFSSIMKFRSDVLAENGRVKSVPTAQGDPELAQALSDNRGEADQLRTTAVLRLQKLAADDLVEYRHILDKLQIVDAEVIQRLYMDDSLRGKRKDAAGFDHERNTLSFPYSDKEVWMDELDHYQARVKDCPALPATKGASL